MENLDNKYLNPSNDFKVNEETKFAPIVACIRYICNRVLKKPSVWVTLGVFGVAYMLFLLFPILFEPAARPYMLSTLNLSAAIFLCFGAGGQGIMRAINTFIDPQKDGTEILLVSKPITRGQIILSRFVFLIGFGLFQAMVTAILSCIPIFVLGTKAFNSVGIPPTTIIFGGFGASFLSFMIMGSVAILVGLFSDGKLARTLPMIVLSLSGTVAVVNAQIAPFISGDPLYTISQNIIKEMNQDIKNTNNDMPKTLPDGTKTSEVKSFSLENNLFHFYYKNETEQFIYVSGNIICKKGLLDYNPIEFKSTVTKDQDGSLKEFDPIQREWVTYFNKKFLETKQINAKWTTAISFINPQSAFLTMSGVGKSSQNGLAVSMLSPNYIYNSFREDAKVTPLEIYDIYDYSSDYTQYAYNVVKFNAQQVDAPWAVAIMWGGLFLISSGILIAAYHRKDFK